MEEKRLGLLEAAIAVWVSSTFARLLVHSVAAGPAASSVLSSFPDASGDGWLTMAILLAPEILLSAVGVVVGVGIVGFRVGYASAVGALAFGATLSMSISYVTWSSTQSGDATGIASPALGVATWPLGILLGTLLPAFLIGAAASRPVATAPPEPPYRAPFA
jgi:hypothetical protein